MPCNNGTSTLTGLPAGALDIYDYAGASAVSLIPLGSGTIVFLGFDWYNAAPIGTQDGGWLNVLARAVTARASMSPVITRQPASQTVVVGDTATFSVLASGSAPLTYQWSYNGTNVPGATSSALCWRVSSHAGGHLRGAGDQFLWCHQQRRRGPDRHSATAVHGAAGRAGRLVAGRGRCTGSSWGQTTAPWQRQYDFARAGSGRPLFLTATTVTLVRARAPSTAATNDLTIEFWLRRQAPGSERERRHHK